MILVLIYPQQLNNICIQSGIIIYFQHHSGIYFSIVLLEIRNFNKKFIIKIYEFINKKIFLKSKWLLKKKINKS